MRRDGFLACEKLLLDACHRINIDLSVIKTDVEKEYSIHQSGGIESLSVSWPCIDKQSKKVAPSTRGDV